MDAVWEFLDMGGYAFYVWASFGLTAVVLAWNVAAPVLRLRRLRRQGRARARRGAESRRAGGQEAT